MNSTIILVLLSVMNAFFLTGCLYAKKNPNTDKYYDYNVQELPPIQKEIQRKKTLNSLWGGRQVSFFQKNRAQQVGDIVTVLVSIKDNASLGNSTNLNKESKTKADFDSFFGITDLIPRFRLKPKLDVTGKLESKSEGEFTRSDEINLQVAAMIVRVLPNGNFIVRGDQLVDINSQSRTLKLIGVVRPRDIDSQNRIVHTKMANARIFYGDSGMNGENIPPYGMEIYSLLAPF